MCEFLCTYSASLFCLQPYLQRALFDSGSCEKNVPLDLGPWLDHNHTPVMAKNTSRFHHPSTPDAMLTPPFHCPPPQVAKLIASRFRMVTFFVLLVGRHGFFSALHIWGEGGPSASHVGHQYRTLGGRAEERKYTTWH